MRAIVNIGDYFVAVQMKGLQSQNSGEIILNDDTRILGERINGVFIVQYYDEDSEMMNSIIDDLSYDDEGNYLVLKPVNRNCNY